MKISAYQILESKGFRVKEENKKNLAARWEVLQNQKENIPQSYFETNKMGLIKILGGESLD